MRRLPAFVLVVVLAVAAACSDDGRALRPPLSGATTPSTPSTAAVAKGSQDNGVIQTVAPSSTIPGLLLTSTAFANGDAIPGDYTCNAATPAPLPLAWTGVPSGAVEMALTVVDPDAGDFVHWLVAGIDPAVTSLATGAAPETAVQLTNSAGTAGWTPPCPPSGKPHRYVFTLYALGQPSGITASMTAADALRVLSGTAFDTTTFAGTYQRP